MPKYKWTLFFIAKTGKDKEDIEELQKLIEELLSVQLNRSISIVLCIKSLVSTIKKIDDDYPNKDKLNDEDFTTSFYNITKSNTVPNKLTYMDENKDFNIQDEEHIASFFKNLVLKEFIAEKYMMFTWDHGCVYGIFKEANGSEISFEDIENLDKEKNSLTLSNYFSVVGFNKITKINEPDNTGDHFKNKLLELKNAAETKAKNMLTISELSNAITWAFERKVDVLVMMNCFMQNFDVGYQLSGNVNFLVAPETYIYMNGYNYKNILKRLCNHPEISPKKAARIIVKSYKTKKYKVPQQKIDALKEVVVSSNNLNYYHEMSLILDKLAVILIDLLESDFVKIKECREKLSFIPRTGTFIIADPFSFLNKIPKLISNKDYCKYLQLFNTVHKKCIKNIYTGSNFKLKNIDAGAYPSGMSIYFPKFKSDTIFPYSEFVTENRLELTKFNKLHLWDNFVVKYAEKVGNEIMP